MHGSKSTVRVIQIRIATGAVGLGIGGGSEHRPVLIEPFPGDCTWQNESNTKLCAQNMEGIDQ